MSEKKETAAELGNTGREKNSKQLATYKVQTAPENNNRFERKKVCLL